MIEVIAVLFNFSIVCLIVWRAGSKPAQDLFLNRKQTIEQQLQEAQILSTKAKQELAEWQKRWQESEAIAHQQFEDAKKTVERFRQTALAHARTEAERIQSEARLVGQSEAAKSEQRVRAELIHSSVTMARNYLASHLEEKDKTHLVSEYLETVRNGHAG
jgi:F0F1-type ATP synthase membrane subunit b/b'